MGLGSEPLAEIERLAEVSDAVSAQVRAASRSGSGTPPT
jgi:hypothetical protein